MNQGIADLADSIYVEKVRRARNLTVGERLTTGIQLFEEALQVMRSGVKHQFPDADDTEVEAILSKRLKRLKQVHENGLYQSEPPL